MSLGHVYNVEKNCHCNNSSYFCVLKLISYRKCVKNFGEKPDSRDSGGTLCRFNIKLSYPYRIFKRNVNTYSFLFLFIFYSCVFDITRVLPRIIIT